MKIRNLSKRCISLMLSVLIISTLFSGGFTAFAATDTKNGFNAGEEGYASLHQYISPTDIEGVYKVRLTVAGMSEIKPTEVSILIDSSSSMNQDGSHKYYDTTSNVADHAMAPGMDRESGDTIFSVTGFAPPALVTTYPGTPGTINGENTMWANLPAYANIGTVIETPFPSWSDFDKYSQYPAGVSENESWLEQIVNAVPGTGTPSDLIGATFPWYYYPLYPGATGTVSATNPFAYWRQPGKENYPTRLKAAITGAQSAIDIFLNEKVNPGYDITGVGVTAFDSADALNEYPFATIKPANPGMDGAGEYAPIQRGFGIGGLQASISYSTDTGFGAGGRHSERMATSGGPVSNAIGDLLTTNNALYNQRVALYNSTVGSTVPDEIRYNDWSMRGMVAYKGMELLKKDIEDNLHGSTNASMTEISAGLEDSSLLLYGTAAPVAPADDTRRFVIMLTDGQDTGDFTQTLNFVHQMKTAGTRFMTIGVDTELGTAGAGDRYNDFVNEPIAADRYPGSNYAPVGGVVPDMDNYEQFLLLAATNLVDFATPGAYAYPPITVGGANAWKEFIDSYRDVPAPQPPIADPQYAAAHSHWDGRKPDYVYIDGQSPNITTEIEKVMETFAKKIVSFGENGQVNAEFSKTVFDLYKYKTEPLVKATAPTTASFKNNGKDLVWDFDGWGLPLTGEYECVFYVKLNDKAEPGIYYSPITGAQISVFGPFKGNGNPLLVGGGYADVNFFKTFTEVYLTKGGDIKQSEEPPAEKEKAAVKDEGGFLPLAAVRLSSNMVVDDASVVFKKAEAKLSKNGRAQLTVSIDSVNNANARYQWQYKEKDGDWTNIFGANSSIYNVTPNKTLRTGSEYEFRCVVTNGAGRRFASDSFKAKITAVKNTSTLVSKTK